MDARIFAYRNDDLFTTVEWTFWRSCLELLPNFFTIGVAKIIKKVCVSPQSVAVAQIGHARHSVGFFSVFFCEDHTEFYFQFIP